MAVDYMAWQSISRMALYTNAPLWDRAKFVLLTRLSSPALLFPHNHCFNEVENHTTAETCPHLKFDAALGITLRLYRVKHSLAVHWGLACAPVQQAMGLRRFCCPLCPNDCCGPSRIREVNLHCSQHDIQDSHQQVQERIFHHRDASLRSSRSESTPRMYRKTLVNTDTRCAERAMENSYVARYCFLRRSVVIVVRPSKHHEASHTVVFGL